MKPKTYTVELTGREIALLIAAYPMGMEAAGLGKLDDNESRAALVTAFSLLAEDYLDARDGVNDKLLALGEIVEKDWGKPMFRGSAGVKNTKARRN